MNTYDFATFALYAIAVFLLVSCIYRRHIRKPRMFFWGVGLFMAGIVISELQGALWPQNPFGGGGLGGGAGGTFGGSFTYVPPSVASNLLSCLGRWVVYASLPIFLLACSGANRAFAQCSRCGYDLTGNDSGVCPECGGKLDEG